jgi:hypothetical protein
MDGVQALEESINDAIDTYNTDNGTTWDTLRVYRWRPRKIETPAVYNWMPQESPFEQRDLARWRDTIYLNVRVALDFVDNNEDMDGIEFYADVFRYVVDGALDQNRPLSGASYVALRTGMRLVSDNFDQIDYLCAEFLIEAWLDRRVH